RDGRVAYHVAGLIPNDPAWDRYVHPSSDLRKDFSPLSFARLPGRSPSRGAVLLSANNKPYDGSYPYRLSAQFERPYRAFRIAELLRSRRRYDVAFFAEMQLDTLSPVDLQFARRVLRFTRTHPIESPDAGLLRALARWDGRYQPDSRAAAFEHTLREDVVPEPRGVAPARSDDALRAALQVVPDDDQPWGAVGGVRVRHPLAPMNFNFLNGDWLPGSGDEYTIHLQAPGFAQGFRAVWDTGNWDRGGLSIPSGESGEPGSGHYTDLTRAWILGRLAPLPFSSGAVARDACAVLTLRPYGS
ncbi:MAG: penicillin acylase family protein, partial [Candidatus Eremiobacteraeota bacterium]|nr:penicillin acylase family protein [Candidatus Eremiobacteraeota bacterium]